MEGMIKLILNSLFQNTFEDMHLVGMYKGMRIRGSEMLLSWKILRTY